MEHVHQVIIKTILMEVQAVRCVNQAKERSQDKFVVVFVALVMQESFLQLQEHVSAWASAYIYVI